MLQNCKIRTCRGNPINGYSTCGTGFWNSNNEGIRICCMNLGANPIEFNRIQSRIQIKISADYKNCITLFPRERPYACDSNFKSGCFIRGRLTNSRTILFAGIYENDGHN